MEILKELGFGHLLTIALALLGGFASFITLKGRVAEAEKLAGEAKSKAETAEKDLNAFKLEAAQNYVRTTTLREFKDDLTKEIKEIEHVVRGLLMGKGRAQA